jgi:hypothetical protein
MSPISPEDPLDVEGTTPVPPPAPVLPDSEAGLAPSAGRRYSASMEPGEISHAAPRRSAVSANSPASAIEPILPPVVRPTAPPPVTVPAPTLPPPPPVTAAIRTEQSPPTPFSQYPKSVDTAPTAPTDAPVIAPPVTSTPLTNTPLASTPATSSPAASLQATAPVSISRTQGASLQAGAAEPSFYSRSTPNAEPTAAEGAPATKPGKPGRTPKPPREKKVREKRVRGAAAATAAVAAGTDPLDVSAAPAPEAAATLKGRSSRPALIVISAVAAVVVLVAGVVWALAVRSTAPSGSPSASGTAAALDPLLTTADLGTLGGVTWGEPVSDEALRPMCLPAQADGLPAAQRSSSPRKIPSATSQTDGVVQVVDTYADVVTATQAYAARLGQLGTCADAVALITGASSITGLADSSDLVRLTVQEQQDQFHSVLVTRTGRSVSMIDVATPAAVSGPDLATVAARALSRQCGGEQGTCPGAPVVASEPPPPGNPWGWLVAADLPRITPGAGRWAAPEPKTVLNVVGSQCEALNLKTVTGAKAAQRTLLLADDSAAPDGFGVDQVVYTFADTAAAASFAKKLQKNIAGCPDRAPTATVAEGPTVKGAGADETKIAGATYLITQKTETNTVVFRVAVMTVDTRVVYLLANPSTTFDFNDSDWAKLSVRAGQRASQST